MRLASAQGSAPLHVSQWPQPALCSLGHILPWHWLVLLGHYLARLSTPAMHLTSSHLVLPKNRTSPYSGQSPIAPPPSPFHAESILNLSLHYPTLWSPRRVVGLEAERSQKPRQREVQRSTGLLMGVGHSERQMRERDRKSGAEPKNNCILSHTSEPGNPQSHLELCCADSGVAAP